MDRAQGLFGQRNLFSSHLLRQGQQTMAYRPDTAHCLFMYGRKQFYVFKWLGGRKLKGIFVIYEYYMKFTYQGS